jgi:hypothetical protein
MFDPILESFDVPMSIVYITIVFCNLITAFLLLLVVAVICSHRFVHYGEHLLRHKQIGNLSFSIVHNDESGRPRLNESKLRMPLQDQGRQAGRASMTEGMGAG